MKKRAFIIAICVCLAAAIACGTLAFFTSTSSKTNKFMTAAYDPSNPNPDPDDIFSVEVLEDTKADPTNPKSVGSDKKNAKGGYDYENLLPGSEAAKKVSVKNTGEYGQYVRVKVTVSKASKWQAFYKSTTVNLAEKLCDIDKTNWELANTSARDAAKDTITYTYNYSKSGVGTVLAAGKETVKPLFTKVTIPAEGFDADDFNSVDGFEVTVLAEAIQSDYTGTIAQAFTAYEAQN